MCLHSPNLDLFVATAHTRKSSSCLEVDYITYVGQFVLVSKVLCQDCFAFSLQFILLRFLVAVLYVHLDLNFVITINENRLGIKKVGGRGKNSTGQLFKQDPTLNPV